VFDDSGSGDVSNVICGLNWVVEHATADNIKVVNLSLGEPGSTDGHCGYDNNDPLHTAVCQLADGGVTVVAAAGNESENLAKSIPAAYHEVVAVTAMADFDGQPGGKAPQATCEDGGRDDTAADFSDYAAPGTRNQDHTIAAPGVCITSDWKDGGTNTISGTSMAAPHVTGLVARCYDSDACSGKDAYQVIDKLRKDAAERPTGSGFVGDTGQPIAGKYYGNLAWDRGY
jgi:subtilisin